MDIRDSHPAILITTGLVFSSLLVACGGGNSGTASTTDTGNTSNTAITTPTTSSSTGASTTASIPTVVTPDPEPVVVTTPPPESRYLKLDMGGNPLPTDAQSWSCVKDKETGLVWETKTDDGGLQDRDWRYRHFHNFSSYASSVDYNGQVLCQNLGSASCDAYSYVNALKGSGVCGRNDWRLPTMAELLSLIEYHADGQPLNIDRTYFADTNGKGPYCSENTIRNPDDCGYAPGSNVTYNADGRIECNYQGVDYGVKVRADNPRGDSMIALRFSGEVQDGKTVYPNANWICYTRLVGGS